MGGPNVTNTELKDVAVGVYIAVSWDYRWGYRAAELIAAGAIFSAPQLTRPNRLVDDRSVLKIFEYLAHSLPINAPVGLSVAAAAERASARNAPDSFHMENSPTSWFYGEVLQQRRQQY